MMIFCFTAVLLNKLKDKGLVNGVKLYFVNFSSTHNFSAEKYGQHSQTIKEF